jgi:hypothetical protein
VDIESPAPPADRLPPDELFVLCTWAVQAVAADLRISEDDAYGLLGTAEQGGRVQVLGNDYFAGVQVDGEWVVVEGRARITLATREWQTLRAMKRQLED